MSLGKKWTLVIGALVSIGVLLEIFVGVQVSLYGAKRGAFEWLRAQHLSSLGRLHDEMARASARDAALLLALEDVTAALATGDAATLPPTLKEAWAWRAPGDFWLVDAGPAGVVTDHPACATSTWSTFRGDDNRRFGLCGTTAFLLGPDASPAAADAPRLIIGRELGVHYVDAVETMSSAHAVMMVGERVAASTVRNEQDERVGVDLSSSALASLLSLDRWFSKEALGVPGTYGGYRLGSQPLGGGEATLDAYLFARSLDGGRGPLPLRLVLIVPALVMDQGALYASAAMAVVGALIVLVLLLVASSLVRSTVAPLRALVDATLQAADGDLSVRVHVTGRDEVSTVARAFNVMAERLEESRSRAIQTEKMAAIGQLAGGVAHEVNNPLGVILGFAQGMQRRLQEDDPFRLPVESITREALRCKALVQELLTFARMEKKGRERVDLNALLEASVILLESKARTVDVAVRCQLSDTPLFVHANRTQIQQVIVNLGANALDATPAGGTVTLRSAPSPSGDVVFEVSDTGSGIDPAIQSRVFEPFFTTKDPGKGTGLGLSLVFEIVQQHGGTIDLVSDLGEGTTFSIHLPAGDDVDAPQDA